MTHSFAVSGKTLQQICSIDLARMQRDIKSQLQDLHHTADVDTTLQVYLPQKSALAAAHVLPSHHVLYWNCKRIITEHL